MESTLISIVMPAKNAAKYIGECLNSILQQSYSNWELIAIDDNSVDETASILKKYSGEDNRIQFYESQGNGIIDALQQAYKISKGQYLTRMDADDRMAIHKLELLLKNLRAKGRGWLATACVSYFSESDLGDGYKRYSAWLNNLTRVGANFSEIYKECVIPSPCWMLYRADFDECGAFEPETYPEDYDLCFRFYKTGLRVIPSSETLHYWRDYKERTSRTHEHYADNTFLKLKVKYFEQLDWDRDKQLILWGAGKKGKSIAQLLQEKGVAFDWICNNPKKIGKEIRGVTLQDQNAFDLKGHLQIIVAVANWEEQEWIKLYLKENFGQDVIDVFYFC